MRVGANEHITVEFLPDRVRKTYREGVLKPGLATAKFHREVAAFQRFDALDVEFVPKLLDVDRAGLSLETDWVAAGRTLIDWLESAPSNSLDPVISQLIRVDRFLYENRINYLESSPENVLVSDDYHVYLVDFEYTFLDERFQQILYDQMFHARLTKVKNSQTRDVFLASLTARRNDFHAFLDRKIINGVLARVRLLRANRLHAR